MRSFTSLPALFTLSLMTPAIAQEDGAPRDDDRGTYSVLIENDALAATDRNYTNGLRGSYLSGTQSFDGPEGWIAKNVLGASEGAKVRRGFAIGQSIFTPDNTEAVNAPADEHPYAGWLYGEYSAVIEQDNAIDTFSLQLGVVGPSAGGEYVQNEFHDLIGSADANGWDDQIEDEPGIVLSYDKRFRALATVGDSYLGADLTPNVGVSVGNVHTNARAGMTLRIGQDLDNSFGPPRIRPSLGGSGYFNPKDDFSWYIFAGVEGRAVGHNIFLDGSLFDSDSPSVDSKHFVADFQAGAVVQVGPAQLALTVVERTDEFERQKDRQRFGALSVSFKY